MMEFLQDINWSPLWISLKTGVVATTIAFFLGIFCARKIMKLKPGSRAVLDGILTMPLVLPPTVAGFFLLLIFSLRRSFGKFLLENFDFKVVQTWKGCVIAAAVIAFPLMYRTARGAFESFDETLAWSAQTLGQSDTWIFWRVRMPACRAARAAPQPAAPVPRIRSSVSSRMVCDAVIIIPLGAARGRPDQDCSCG